MNANPYAPPAENKSGHPRVGIATVVLVVFSLAAIAASYAQFGAVGIAPVVGMTVIIWFTVARVDNEHFAPLNRRRMTIAELLVILANLAVLHGLTLPAVTTRGRPRVPTANPSTSVPGDTSEQPWVHADASETHPDSREADEPADAREPPI